MSEQKLRMQKAARGLKIRGCSQYTINRINKIGLEVAYRYVKHGPENSTLILKTEIERNIEREFKEQHRNKYGVISWAWVVWFVLPKVIAWFVDWWINDMQEQQERTKQSFQHAIDRARGEALG